jgi:DNA modification methylase
MSVSILHGNCLDVLKTLPSESVQMACTSPPYYGLRSYLPDGHPDKGKEIGLEQSPQEYVAQLVAVFAEIRRVLRKDGTAFLNIGDSYAGSWGNQGRKETRGTQRPINGEMLTPVHDGRYPAKSSNTGKIPPGWGLKPKDLMMIPNRVAIALQDDGWWVRSEIIWSKAAPMPESVRDRPTCAHEKVWLLTKAASYFYDADAVREPCAPETAARYAAGYKEWGKGQFLGSPTDKRGSKQITPEQLSAKDGRNLRNVWHLNPEPFPGAHFATMPPTLAERCIKAGTSEKGQCPHCGSPWVRVVESERRPGSSPSRNDAASRRSAGNADRQDAEDGRSHRVVLGSSWSPSCACPAHEPVPQTVLDPFAGAGTTLLVADRLQRHAVGIELNPEYAALARQRLTNDAPMFAEFAA